MIKLTKLERENEDLNSLVQFTLLHIIPRNVISPISLSMFQGVGWQEKIHRQYHIIKTLTIKLSCTYHGTSGGVG
jgi:hypothetical protein